MNVRAVTYGNNLLRAEAEKSVSSRCARGLGLYDGGDGGAARVVSSFVRFERAQEKSKAKLMMRAGDLRFCPSTRVENKHGCCKKCLCVMHGRIHKECVVRPAA